MLGPWHCRRQRPSSLLDHSRWLGHAPRPLSHQSRGRETGATSEEQTKTGEQPSDSLKTFRSAESICVHS
eukprot:3297123-Lingulodinium_polyedra.AAC.2